MSLNMQKLLLSKKAIYQLQHLVKVVRKNTGVRYHISDKDSIVALLSYCSLSPDFDISTYFNRFVKEINEEQKNMLSHAGLSILNAPIHKINDLARNRDDIRPMN